MPAPMAYQVGSNGAAAFTDGAQQQPLVDRYGNTRMVEYRGKYGEPNSRGQLFHFCTLVAGVTLPIFTNTAHVYGLRNPTGSNVVLELVRLDFGYLSGTEAPGDVVMCQAPVPGDTIATGSGGVTAATQAGGQSGRYGGPGGTSLCKMLTAITTVAPTVILRTLGLSTSTMPATNATQGLYWSGYNFDGTDLIYPGQIMLFASTVAAGAGVNVINCTALELPWLAN